MSDPGDQINVTHDRESWRPSELETELSALLNRVSAENGSDTPDFILTTYLLGALHAFNVAVRHRDAWYGRERRQHEGIPVAARALLTEYGAEWLPLAKVRAAGSEAADAGAAGFIRFPAALTPEQEAEFRARWRACWLSAKEAQP